MSVCFLQESCVRPSAFVLLDCVSVPAILNTDGEKHAFLVSIAPFFKNNKTSFVS